MKWTTVSKNFNSGRGGMVLVMALWILAILSLFALFIGVGVRQRLVLVSRLEKRDALHYTAKAAVQRARSVFLNMPQPHALMETAWNKKFKHNNPEMFEAIFIGEGKAQVSYLNYDRDADHPVVFFGLEDETGKLNVNYASIDELGRLFILMAGVGYERSQDLAAAIVAWRTPGDPKAMGFDSEDYYKKLNFPYEPKRRSFELLEELLLVKGMNPAIFNRLKSFLTVYGNGRVNINTASRPVLTALGLSPEVVDILIFGRNGTDQIPATDDDYIFSDRGARLGLIGFLPLKPEELAQIDQLYVERKIATVSHFFRARVHSVLADGKETSFIDCVIHAIDGKILFWREY
jgi:type II secretory pathway component PulK